MATFKQNTIALVYDFDLTLSPKPMQEYTILATLGKNPKVFWDKCNSETKEHNADPMLTYMRLLLKEMEIAEKCLYKQGWENLGKNIEYFKGVEGFFSNINDYVKTKFGTKISVEHYIISAGHKEILNGTSIKKYFKEIFASKYYFSKKTKNAEFPTVVVNSAVKTQFLFEINKGTQDINGHMDKKDRPVPFSNMLYFGDGETDVPCMTIVKKNGGHSMAVHKPNNPKKIYICKSLLKANRIDYYAPANYSQNSTLDKRVKLIIDSIGANILLEKEKFDVRKKL